MGSRPPPPPLGEALFELGVKRPVFATWWNISQRDSRKAPAIPDDRSAWPGGCVTRDLDREDHGVLLT